MIKYIYMNTVYFLLLCYRYSKQIIILVTVIFRYISRNTFNIFLYSLVACLTVLISINLSLDSGGQSRTEAMPAPASAPSSPVTPKEMSRWKIGSHDQPPILPDFVGNPGIKVDMPEDARCIDYVNLFLDDPFLDMIVEQTNLYAKQFIKSNTITSGSRVKLWNNC